MSEEEREIKCIVQVVKEKNEKRTKEKKQKFYWRVLDLIKSGKNGTYKIMDGWYPTQI